LTTRNLFVASIAELITKCPHLSALAGGDLPQITYFKNDVQKPVIVLNPDVRVKGVQVAIRLIPSVRRNVIVACSIHVLNVFIP
jgi:hypothetical protein